MGALARTAAGVAANTRSFAREPFTLALLVVLPAVSIQIYGVSLAQFPDVGLFQVTGSLETTGRITGAVFATGALAGVVGLFQMMSARDADRRLSICGFRGVELLAARLATVVAVGVLVGGVSTATLLALLSRPVEAPLVVFGGLALAGVVYGLVGVLVGTVLPRQLEGSLTLVMLADVDNVFASGLFGIDPGVTRFAPLSHPHEVVTQAVVDGSLATGHLAPALAHLLAVAALAVGAYAYAAGGDAR